MRFKEWIEAKKITVKEVAKDLDTSEMTVYRWYANTAIPRPEMMQKIVEYTGGEVQPNDFYEKQNNG